MNYEDMPRLDPQVAMHRLNINPDVKPVKQQQRRFRLEIMEAIDQKSESLTPRDLRNKFILTFQMGKFKPSNLGGDLMLESCAMP